MSTQTNPPKTPENPAPTVPPDPSLPWIHVSDRLPTRRHPVVLATDGYGHFLANYVDDVVGWIIVFGPVPASGVLITHWLPLSLPPQTVPKVGRTQH